MVLGLLAFVAVGLDLAVALLCLGWPRGELWPLDERWASATMLGAAASASAAGLLTLHAGSTGALWLYLSGGLLGVVTGLCGAIGPNVPHARALKGAIVVAAIAAGAPAIALVQPIGLADAEPWLPPLHVVPRSLALYAVIIAVCEGTEAVTIVRRWPRTEARAVLVAGVGRHERPLAGVARAAQ